MIRHLIAMKNLVKNWIDEIRLPNVQRSLRFNKMVFFSFSFFPLRFFNGHQWNKNLASLGWLIHFIGCIPLEYILLLFGCGWWVGMYDVFQFTVNMCINTVYRIMSFIQVHAYQHDNLRMINNMDGKWEYSNFSV